MPLLPGKKNIGRNITELEEHGSRPRKHNQILAIALHEAYDKKAEGGGLEKFAFGGTGGLSAAPLNPDVVPGVTVPSAAGIGNASALPQSQGIPLGLQLGAIQAMTQADRSIRNRTAGQSQDQSSGSGDQTVNVPMMAVGGGLPKIGAVPKGPKGGVFGVLNAKPPRALTRITEPQVQSGFLHSTVPGRTDRLATQVRSGSHIIPADVVSAFGQGNSLAGARNLDMTMRALPSAFAKGGRTQGGSSSALAHPHHRLEGHEPVLLAGGEYVISPEEVEAIGEGDRKKGHDILDKMIVNVRHKEAKKMLKLPGPKK